MKVLFFGIFDPGYSRNKILKYGFERNGWTVTECRVDPVAMPGIKKYIRLARMGMRARREKHDLVLVCFPGHTVVWLARLIFGRAILFDALVSLYDSNVLDRKRYGPRSLRALRDWVLDASSCRFAAKVLFDTNEHIRYFSRAYALPDRKFLRVLIGADDTIFKPRSAPPAEEHCIVEFHGSFIPLQGIQYILQAAHLLRDEKVGFSIVGGGQESEKMQELAKELELKNVEFVGRVPASEVPAYVASAHIVLGIFGDTQKAQRAIPNKVYEAMAMGKAVITADTPAIRELPRAESSLFLVPSADAAALAQAVRALKADPARRHTLEKNARALFKELLLPEKLVKNLVDACVKDL